MSSSKQPAWWFFWLVVAPHMLQSILFAYMVFSGENANNAAWTSVIAYLMSQTWMHVVIPDHSLYEEVTVQEKTEKYRRFDKSGVKICVVYFIIFEIVLLVVGLFSHMKLKYVFPVLHACSLYYFILGLLNVLRYEDIQYDVSYYAARAVLDRFNYESKLGFIAGRDGKIGLNYPFLDILIWTVGFLAYWGIHKLLS